MIDEKLTKALEEAQREEEEFIKLLNRVRNNEVQLVVRRVQVVPDGVKYRAEIVPTETKEEGEPDT